jgi:osmotically-inducible protein OsmY
MGQLGRVWVGTAYLIASASFVACTRSPDSPSSGSSGSSGSAGSAGSTVGEDVQGVAKASEKAAKDLGDKARKGLQDVTDKAGGGSEEAWLTTKVKSELTRVGLDPLHVHVDTAGKVVTLSGTVESAAAVHKAVSAAKSVSGVLGVQDHLFVNPAQR